MMKKRIILILIVLAAAGVAAMYVFRGMGSNKSGRIVVSGNIELTEVNIAFKTAGRLIERTVDEGDAVKKGQVIARLDRDQLMAQREREVAGLESARTQLAQSETSLEWEKATLAADIEQRQADLASNEARLAELKNGARPQEKLDARAAVECGAIGARPRQEGLGPRPDAVQGRRHFHRAVRPIPQPLGERASRAEIRPRSARRWCWPGRARK